LGTRIVIFLIFVATFIALACVVLPLAALAVFCLTGRTNAEVPAAANSRERPSVLAGPVAGEQAAGTGDDGRLAEARAAGCPPPSGPAEGIAGVGPVLHMTAATTAPRLSGGQTVVT
jgi:hypothetical protein